MSKIKEAEAVLAAAFAKIDAMGVYMTLDTQGPCTFGAWVLEDYRRSISFHESQIARH